MHAQHVHARLIDLWRVNFHLAYAGRKKKFSILCRDEKNVTEKFQI